MCVGSMGFFKKKKTVDLQEDFVRDYKPKVVKNEIKVLCENEEYDEVIRRTKPLFEKGKKVPLDIMQIVAASYYYKQDYEHSLPLFEEIASQRNDVESWFNVLMSLMPSNKTQEGKEVFDKILKMHKGFKRDQPIELSIPYIKYYYSCGLNYAGLFDEALEHLEYLKKIYIELKITDDTFVYIRGIPFLSQTLDLARKVFDGLGKDFSNSDFLTDLEKGIDKEGKSLIKRNYRS
jgi:tetratricopeptide (TPR) repeat protein